MPGVVKTYGIGYAAQSIAASMCQAGFPASLHCIAVDKGAGWPGDCPAVPRMFQRIGFRMFDDAHLQRSAWLKYRKSLSRNDIAYVWPGDSVVPLSSVASLAEVCGIERINTHTFFAREILSAEYRRLGLGRFSGITDYVIKNENEDIEVADFIFCPSPIVAESYKNAGVRPDNILTSTYGYCTDYQQLSACRQELRLKRCSHRDHGPVFIFVGRIGIRKGAHLLIEYWKKAEVDGQLWIIGTPDEDFLSLHHDFQSERSVRYIPFTNDLSEVYANADVFVLPSLEEGSPLVTYQALASSLPCLVTPMGGGGVVEDGINGFVCEPHDENKWVSCFRTLERDAELRAKMSSASGARAETLTWDAVGAQRAALLSDFLRGKCSS